MEFNGCMIFWILSYKQMAQSCSSWVQVWSVGDPCSLGSSFCLQLKLSWKRLETYPAKLLFLKHFFSMSCIVWSCIFGCSLDWAAHQCMIMVHRPWAEEAIESSLLLPLPLPHPPTPTPSHSHILPLLHPLLHPPTPTHRELDGSHGIKLPEVWVSKTRAVFHCQGWRDKTFLNRGMEDI